MNNKNKLSIALNLAEQMLISGGEVSRVEDTVERILRSYNATEVNVFIITSSIVVTAKFDNNEMCTQTKRILNYKTNFQKLDLLNSLSRNICENKIDSENANKELERITKLEEYSFTKKLLSSALITGVFTIFFGGKLLDGIISAFIGALVCLSKKQADKSGLNQILTNIVCSFIASIFAYFAVRSGLGESSDKIIIGNIMPLIPGIALTNSMRDIITGDTISGSLRFFEACLTALAIAGGYILAAFACGGI